MRRLATKSGKPSLIFAELLGRCRIDWRISHIVQFFPKFGLYKFPLGDRRMLTWMSIAVFPHSWLGSWSFVLWRSGYKQKTTLLLLFDKDMEIWRTQIAKKNNAMALDLLMFSNMILDIIYLYTVIGVKICLIYYLMFDIQCTVYRYAIYLIFFTSHMYKHNSFDSNEYICSYLMFICSTIGTLSSHLPFPPSWVFSQGHSVGSSWFTRCCRESGWCVGGVWKFHPWMTHSHKRNENNYLPWKP